MIGGGTAEDAFARSFRWVRLDERSRAERLRIDPDTVLLGKGKDDCRAGAEPGATAGDDEDADADTDADTEGILVDGEHIDSVALQDLEPL